MNNPQPWWLTWPPAEVAGAILPLFSSAPYVYEFTMIEAIVGWCRTGQYHQPAGGYTSGDELRKFGNPDSRAVAEAIQVLEHAGLLMDSAGGDRVAVGLTRLGQHALQTNTVRQHLGLGDLPPSA
ncbi:hypothetical protein AWB90_22755 [Mycobacterium paraense]|uniref:DNA-binding protein n=1 Tax=Mycobacterium paraense TaxID=767916 RepID=A0A1X2A5I1_9MYCO|nr:hypothetical protein [Mycobacterium paraense]ORW40746.1 hypothetical protein AWB90_22755 [Mycobacterium paraense]